MKTTIQNAHCGEPAHLLDLVRENVQFAATGGVSENNRGSGFIPAFKDMATGRTYRSRFANGAPAPIHVLDGLPAELVIGRDGDTVALRSALISGFLRDGRFLTREEAANYTLLH